MELLKKLDIFSDYTFDEDTHTYYYKGNKVCVSVTSLIGEYDKPFDKDYWSDYKAKQQGVTQQEILSQWIVNSEKSCNSGTIFHSFMEHSLAGKPTYKTLLEKSLNESYSNEVLQRVEKLKILGSKFIEDSKHKLIPVKSEFTVGINTIVAGQIDQIFYNTKSDELEVWDWKTNKNISTRNTYGEKLLYPLNNLDNCEFNHYSLQLSTYKYILEYYGIKTGSSYFVWFNENNSDYQIYKCADYTKASALIIDNKRKVITE